MKITSRVVFGVVSCVVIYGLYRRAHEPGAHPMVGILNDGFSLHPKGSVLPQAVTAVEQPPVPVISILGPAANDMALTNSAPVVNGGLKPVATNDELIKAANCLEGMFVAVQKNKKSMFEQWNSYHSKIKNCLKELKAKLPILTLQNKDETKSFLRPVNSSADLTVVTLGIGQDVLAELQLKQEYPQAAFFGVDLDAKVSGKMYTEQLGGRFLQGLVGAAEGTYKASIYKFNNKDGYSDHKLEHFSFKKVLETFGINDTIDYLLMDIEGDEFELMADLATYSYDYPIICQIDVEYHDPRQYSKAGAAVVKMHEKMAHDGIYLYSQVATAGVFHRSYYINIMNPYCLNKFFGLVIGI